MIKIYRLPIKGTVLKREPLKGGDEDPICIIPLSDLPNYPTYFNEESQTMERCGYGFRNLDYNIDEEWCEVELRANEEFHDWLAGILPQLRDIQKEKGWKLDKSKMVERLEKDIIGVKIEDTQLPG